MFGVSRTVLKPEPGFRAELPGLDLATLIQMTCARRARLVVRVSSYGEEGYLYSAEGRLVHATVGELVGDEAVLRMLAWPAGDFSICERPFPLHPTVVTSTEGLLLRAAARVDEAALARETDNVLSDEAGLAEQLEGPEPTPTAAQPYAPLPALKLPQQQPGKPPLPPRAAQWPIDAPRSAELPPVSLARITEPPRRPPEPPVSMPRPIAPARPSRLPPLPPAKSRSPEDAAIVASVRVDVRGEVVGTFGPDDQLGQLVAYVSRVAALVQADFALEPFDALHAELTGKRVLIYRDAGELVGVVMKPSAEAQELRQRLGV